MKDFLKPITIGIHQVELPIIQGGMGIAISLSNLAASVSLCGGVGTISAAQPAFLDPDFHSNPIVANVRAIKRNIAEALEKRKEFVPISLKDRLIEKAGPIAVNIMCAAAQYEEYVRAAVEGGAHMIVSGAGLPMNLPDILRKMNNTQTALIPIVSSARATNLIIKNWQKKYDRLPDAIVFEGPNAGGHLGYKEEELSKTQERFYEIIREIKDIILQYSPIPLIAGGGITTKEEIQMALDAGADGVQISTPFVTTKECDAHENFKQAYLDAKEEDTVIIKSPVGMPGRALNNAFVKRTSTERIPPIKCNKCLSHCEAATTQYCITQALINAANGDTVGGLVFCGAKVYLQNKITSVKEVIEKLLTQ